MRKLISTILLVSLPAIVGLSSPISFATERLASILATNAALAVSAPVSNLAANAQSLALDALARPLGVSTAFVQSAVAPVAELSTNAYIHATNAQSLATEALARPVGVSTDYVNDAIAPVAVLATNAYDLAGTAVRTNSSHSLQIGTESFALANYSFAFGYLVTASGVGSRAFGYNSTASGHYSTADGSGCTASGTGSMAFGQLTTASAGFATAFGRSTVASGAYSLAIGAQAIASDFCSFVWNGYGEEPSGYSSHGEGTFNINPVNGSSGFYIGETNLQTLLDEKLSIDHENEASAHNGRITALENRPAGITTNDVLPWITLADNYSTNGPLRVVVSNRIFSLWSLK